MSNKTKLPEYQIWLGMRKRCYNPKSISFAKYGARGVTVCEEWQQDFDTFLKDMGPRPTPQHSLDRRDGKLGYTPSNCRWATALEQGMNTTRVHLFTYRGLTLSLHQWAQKLDLSYGALVFRILRQGRSFESAVSAPIDSRRGKRNTAVPREKVVETLAKALRVLGHAITTIHITKGYHRMFREAGAPKWHAYTPEGLRLESQDTVVACVARGLEVIGDKEGFVAFRARVIAESSMTESEVLTPIRSGSSRG